MRNNLLLFLKKKIQAGKDENRNSKNLKIQKFKDLI